MALGLMLYWWLCALAYFFFMTDFFSATPRFFLLKMTLVPEVVWIRRIIFFLHLTLQVYWVTFAFLFTSFVGLLLLHGYGQVFEEFSGKLEGCTYIQSNNGMGGVMRDRTKLIKKDSINNFSGRKNDEVKIQIVIPKSGSKGDSLPEEICSKEFLREILETFDDLRRCFAIFDGVGGAFTFSILLKCLTHLILTSAILADQSGNPRPFFFSIVQLFVTALGFGFIAFFAHWGRFLKNSVISISCALHSIKKFIQ